MRLLSLSDKLLGNRMLEARPIHPPARRSQSACWNQNATPWLRTPLVELVACTRFSR